MLGWINDCIEKLVIEKFGVNAWHAVKEKAGCEIVDGGFVKLEHYTDKSTYDLVQAASELTGLSSETVLEVFGQFFVEYICKEGYENLLCCQGSTLKDWMTNINEIHQHLQTTFPKKMIMPEFWIEQCPDGALLLHYHSKRGNILAPVAKGLVTEVAQRQFGLDIIMDKKADQDRKTSKFTTWRVTTKDPNDLHKLQTQIGGRNGVSNDPTQFMTCPMTGMRAPPMSRADSRDSMIDSVSSAEIDFDDYEQVIDELPCLSDLPAGCPMSRRKSGTTCSTGSFYSTESTHRSGQPTGSLSAALTKKLFPYHIILSADFKILQVGQDLCRILKTTEVQMIGSKISEVFKVSKPLEGKWNWDWLRKLEDQTFYVQPIIPSSRGRGLRFSSSVVLVADNPPEAMLMMNPDAKNLNQLRKMNLTMSDLPIHGSHREAVFLREHLGTQMNNALQMEKLTRSLAREKTLLESMLPKHAAEGLRSGMTVEPMMHENVTLFFSDIVGFTKMCGLLDTTDIISMLNRLYCVMDHLAKKFDLYKIETIGDAYVCCSGLPTPDENHARNIANFAVAVLHCVKHILSPVDGKPISLRIGLHTGSCASGIIGQTLPRYCVFGDTVNTTSRHESTGAPNKIHISQQTQNEIIRSAPDLFNITERGLVEMKGKGQLTTYWLEGHPNNDSVNKVALEQLDEEVSKLLKDTSFNIRLHNKQESVDGVKESKKQESTVMSDHSRKIKENITEKKLEQPPPEQARPKKSKVGIFPRIFARKRQVEYFV